MDNKKPKQFTVNAKSFKDEDKQSSEQIQFHNQSPRFVNSKNQSPSQSPQLTYKDETQNSPIQSPKQGQQHSKINSQILLESGGKTTIQRAPAVDQSNNLNDFNLFDYKGEKDFYVKMSSKLNEIASNGDQQVVKFLEKVYKRVLEEDFSLSQLQRTITKSKNNWKELLKIKNQSNCQSLIVNILPHFSRALQRRSLSNIQDLLKITLLYSYEQYNGIEKSLNSILDLFTKMLQIPQKSEEEDTISNHVQRLVLLNIQSFCIPPISSKFQTEFQLIFKRIYELIMHFFNLSSNQQSQQSQQTASSACTSASSISNESGGKYYSFLRFLATLLRTGNMVLAELKDNKTFSADANNQKLTEKVFLRIFKYVFIGNPTFHLQIFGTNQKGILQYRHNNVGQSQDYFMNSNNSSRNNLTSNSQMNNSFSASSQSEWSENDDLLGGNDRNKVEMIECKIRNYTCLLLQTIIRQFPTILKSQWQTLIKSKNMTKDFLRLLKSNQSLEERRIPQTKYKNDSKKIKEEEEETEKDKQKVQENTINLREYSILYPNYMETSLLSSLVFEENNKIKGNILSTLSVLIENLPSKQLLIGLDVEKFEKQTPSFKPQSYLIYQSYKNIHFTLIHILQTLCIKKSTPNNSYQNIILQSPHPNHDSSNQSVTQLDWFINEQDEEIISLCNQILKVYISFFNSTIQFEKMPFKDGIDLLLRQFLLKVLRHVKTNEASLEALHLKFNALQILNCIAKCNVRFDQIANYYLLADFKNNSDRQIESQNKEYQYNIFDLCLADIKLKTQIAENNNPGAEQSQCLHDVSLVQKEDALRELISLESINLLINFQINYFDRTLIYSQNNFLIWQKIQETIDYFQEERNKNTINKKRLLLLYELIIMIAERRNAALSFIQQLQKKKNKEKNQQQQNNLKEDRNEQNNENENQQEEIHEDLEEEDDKQSQSNQNQLSFQTVIIQNPEFIDTLQKFEKEIFSKYIIEKLKQFIQQSLQNENNKSQTNEESDLTPIIICCLNLSVQITNEQWIQNPDIFKLFKDKLFSLNVVPLLRFHYFKTLGCIVSCSTFNQDPQNCRQILEILLKEKQQIGVKKTAANLSVFSKLAQSLANWCYNVQDYSILSIQTLQNLLAAIIDLASSPKDKISPHGLRALGIFLMKIQSQIYMTICDPTKEDEVLRKLLCENLTHKSSKVVWNACVAIQNIFTNLNFNLEHKKLTENKLGFFFSLRSISQLTHSLEDVLLSINNQKSQIYALRALKSIMNHPSSTLQVTLQSEDKNNQNSKEIESEILTQRIPHLLNVLTDIGSDIYSFQNAHNFGESVVKFLIQMIQRVHSLRNSNQILIEFIREKYYQVISSFSQYIYQLWKSSKLDHHQSFLKEQSFQDSEKDIFNIKVKDLSQMEVLIKPEQQTEEQSSSIKQEQNSEQKPQEVYEELLVKGQDEFKSVVFDFKFIKKTKDLREQLKLLKQSSQILQQVIDQNDDLSVSLTIYDHIKEYAAINIDSHILKFSLH